MFQVPTAIAFLDQSDGGHCLGGPWGSLVERFLSVDVGIGEVVDAPAPIGDCPSHPRRECPATEPLGVSGLVGRFVDCPISRREVGRQWLVHVGFLGRFIWTASRQRRKH